MQWRLRHASQRVSDRVGGPARLKVIVLLACVMALQAADLTSVGAVAVPLERALRITNTEVGLLVTVSTAIGAVGALPFGVMVDRLARVRVIYLSILVWCAAEVVSAAAQSYLWLLVTRLALGAVVITAAPSVASVVGDLFKVSERGRIYGYVLTGQLAGAGVGILISGDLGAISWRASFAWLAVPGLALAFAIWRYLPEPARGGQSRMAEGATVMPSAADATKSTVPERPVAAEGSAPAGTTVQEKVAEQGVAPRRRLVLIRDPGGRGLLWAVRYVLTIPTNRFLIVASALGYFYFQGMETFAVEYLRGRFGLSQSAGSSLLVLAVLGAIAGALVAGRLADRLISGGRIPGRVLVAGGAFVVAVVLLTAGLVSSSLGAAIPLFFVGAAGLGGANAPLDAARLDIMHSRLWGRAEAVRTSLQSLVQAAAPLLFGYVSTRFGERTSGLGHPVGPVAKGASGLGVTFLIMLAPVLAAGVISLVARRTYPVDVATAMASEHASDNVTGT